MAQKVVFLTSTTAQTYTIPSDFGSLISVEAIGGGGSGTGAFGGGGGGAYAKTTTITNMAAGGTAYYDCGGGAVGIDSYFSYGLGSSKPTSAFNGVLAKGGTASTSIAVGTGGQASECIGNIKYSGGNGGATSGSGTGSGRGGGGGAAGPGGAGANGGAGAGTNNDNASAGGGGGGASLTAAGNNGSAGVSNSRGGAGGNGGGGTGGGTGGLSGNATAGTAGTGGGGGGAGAGGATGDYNGGDGATGNYWTATAGGTAGSGGGGGGSTRSGSSGNGGQYGGGGACIGGGSNGTGAQGIIVFTYETAPKKTVFITTTGSSTFTVPSDFGSLAAVEAIGGGAGGKGGGGGAAAGGGGAYAKSTSVSGLNPGQTCYVSVGTGGTSGGSGADSWFNAVSNAAPTLASQGVLAKAGTQDGNATNQPGGAAGSCVGDVKYSGGTGSVGATVNESRNRGGGGGAAGPFGAGGDGGSGYDTTNAHAGAGGGGGAGTADGAGVAGTTGWLNAGGVGGKGGIQLIGYTSNSNGSSTNIALTVPSGTADGDLMVMYVKSSSTTAPSTPSGWTVGVTSSTAAIGLYYRTASSEPASYTVTTSGTSVANIGHIVTYRGAAIDVIGTVSASANPIVSASVTVTLPNAVLLNFIGSGATGVTYITPSGYAALDSMNDVAVSTGVFYKSTLSDAGATGTLSVTGTDTGRGTQVALKPTSTTSGTGATSTWSAGAGTAGTGAGGGGALATSSTTGNIIGGAGGSGYIWMQSSNSATAGPGGGGGGATSASAAAGGAGGLYGGGGGEGSGAGGSSAGAQGIVVFSYYVNTNLPSSGTNVYGRQNTGFKVFDSLSQTTQDLGERYVSKDYLLDVYPNIASATGTRTAPGLWAWGANDSGNNNSTAGIGDGTTISKSTPIQVGQLTNWKQISANGASVNSAAIKTDGTLWTWGSNPNGSLGQGSGAAGTGIRSTPVQVGTLNNWKQVEAGNIMAAVKTDGTLWTWGDNFYGQLGIGDTVNRSSPVQVGTLTNWKQTSVPMAQNGANTIYALKADGTLWSIGYGAGGALGNSTTTSVSSPVQIGSLTNWKQVSGTMAIKIDGTLWAWGNNGTSGALGTNNSSNYSSPVQVGTLTDWKQISAVPPLSGTEGYGFAIKTDGTLWGWGGNSSGVLGDGTTISKSSPIQIGSLTNWKFVKAGLSNLSTAVNKSVFAIKTDGTLWAWGTPGSNNNTTNGASLGNGTTLSYSSPIQIGSLTSWKQVSNGGSHTLAIQDGYI